MAYENVLTQQELREYTRHREREIKMIRKDMDFERFAKLCLRIKAKDGELIPFVLNDAQKMLHKEVMRQEKEDGKVRIIVLKGRQQGISTYIQAYFYFKTSQSEGKSNRAFVLSHESSSTAALYEMVRRFHEHCDPEFKPMLVKSNIREMIFESDGGYKCATASGTGQVGRGSTFNLFHGSETAYYPPNNIGPLTTGCLQTVPDDSGAIFLESTANGMNNYFHNIWQQAVNKESDFTAVFIPWHCQSEYRRGKQPFKLTDEEKSLREFYKLTYGQLRWRRAKIQALAVDGRSGIKMFDQEYPTDQSMAFCSGEDHGLISIHDIIRARNQPPTHGTGPLIVSCDPARYGADSTVIGRRRGRKVYDFEVHNNLDTMEVADMLHKIIEQESPAAVFIDAGGLGIGCVDRLIQIGHFDVLRPMNGGAKPMDTYKYYNKRAEMFGILGDALRETTMPISFPDDDLLQIELSSIQYQVDPKGRIKLESKSAMRSRGMSSPDRADSCALLYSEPVYDEEHTGGVYLPEIDY